MRLPLHSAHADRAFGALCRAAHHGSAIRCAIIPHTCFTVNTLCASWRAGKGKNAIMTTESVIAYIFMAFQVHV
jgi:hypothetical protein